MPDENGTEATRPDAPSAEESIFGDAANDTAAAGIEEQDANAKAEKDIQDSDNAGEPADAETQAGRRRN